MCTVLVVHLGALPSVVALVAASGFLVVVGELTHREQQVRRRCEAQVLETAVCVVQQDVVHLGAPRIVHIGCDAVRTFLQVDPHDFEDFSVVVGDGSGCNQVFLQTLAQQLEIPGALALELDLDDICIDRLILLAVVCGRVFELKGHEKRDFPVFCPLNLLVLTILLLRVRITRACLLGPLVHPLLIRSG